MLYSIDMNQYIASLEKRIRKLEEDYARLDAALFGDYYADMNSIPHEPPTEAEMEAMFQAAGGDTA